MNRIFARRRYPTALAVGVALTLGAWPFPSVASPTTGAAASSPVLVTPSAAGVLPGWKLPMLGPVGAQWQEGRSGDGRTQILVEPDSGEQGPTTKKDTRFAVVALSKGGTIVGKPRIIEIAGRFGYDAISNAGTRLFVTENRDVESPGTYRVRMIDVTTGKLDPRVLSDKRIDTEAFETPTTPAEELMYGSAMVRVRNPLRTHWIFTLYDAQGKHPFVHALNTEGYAMCIDLPSHGKKVSELATAWKLRATSTTVTVSNATLAKAWQFDMGTTTLRPA